MGGAMSALVPPLRVSVEEEVGGANSRHGRDTCKRRVVLLDIKVFAFGKKFFSFLYCF